jgi:antitoxin VapB
MNAPVHARTFKSGNSEALRLPKGLGFGIGTEVVVERSGDTLTIRAVVDPARERAELDRFLADMLAIGTPSDGVQPRPPVEWIDRPGL